MRIINTSFWPVFRNTYFVDLQKKLFLCDKVLIQLMSQCDKKKNSYRNARIARGRGWHRLNFWHYLGGWMFEYFFRLLSMMPVVAGWVSSYQMNIGYYLVHCPVITLLFNDFWRVFRGQMTFTWYVWVKCATNNFNYSVTRIIRPRIIRQHGLTDSFILPISVPFFNYFCYFTRIIRQHGSTDIIFSVPCDVG